MPPDESKGSQLDAIGSLDRRQLDNTAQGPPFGLFLPGEKIIRPHMLADTLGCILEKLETHFRLAHDPTGRSAQHELRRAHPVGQLLDVGAVAQQIDATSTVSNENRAVERVHAPGVKTGVASMAETSYYVYALKDPRTSPAQPFYIGKGTGTRAHDHLLKPDNSQKGRRIREILDSGQSVLVARLVEDLSEIQALKLEAELISSFGTEATGGPLTNAVLPSGLGRKVRKNVVVPQGVKEKAQIGLQLLKSAILEFARANPNGITNADAASLLGLRSDYGGGSKDYLSYSLLGMLMRGGLLRRDSVSKRHIATTN